MEEGRGCCYAPAFLHTLRNGRREATLLGLPSPSLDKPVFSVVSQSRPLGIAVGHRGLARLGLCGVYQHRADIRAVERNREVRIVFAVEVQAFRHSLLPGSGVAQSFADVLGDLIEGPAGVHDG